MEFVSSQGGQRKVLYQGHIYVKHEDLAHGMTSYECEKRRHHNCKAKIKVLREELVGLVNEHTHDLDASCQEVARGRQDSRSHFDESSPRLAVLGAAETSHRKPEERHTRRAIRRCQRAIDVPQPARALDPLQLVTAELGGQQQTDADCESLLLHDSDTEDCQTARTAVEAVSRIMRRSSKYCRRF